MRADDHTIGEHVEVVGRAPRGANHFWQFVARLCGCEKFELPNLGSGLHREPLFISAHMSLTTEAHSVVAIYNQPQMAATIITAVLHDSLGRLWKAWCHPRWRYGESSTHARSPIQRAPCPNCNPTRQSGHEMIAGPESVIQITKTTSVAPRTRTTSHGLFGRLPY